MSVVMIRTGTFVVCAHVFERFFERLVGLTVCRNRCMCAYFPRCRSVHTFGMRTPIDIAFIDERGKVVIAETDVPPNRVKSCRAASSVVERVHQTDCWFVTGSDVVVEKVV